MESNLENKAIIRGGVYYFQAGDAKALIQMCKDNNYKILGIDSVIITEKKTQPVLEHSIDYSDQVKRGNWDEAIAFIQSKANLNYMFEVVYDKKDESLEMN
ncbi:hypothetical protein [Paenibacillus sp.]|uniref:hypothetical protein n=1 Tax=Paenibacillus sp. TaxID=58172 RepID=UPI00281DEDF7|nr:hypothetical protein [Paenibacillus sp.]MDR0271416.1 hypothetical protein [Paenibacillus sp.]